ncbi:MAG: membrane dipeptidase [Bacteroidetes bacterium]|nr:membrane dipeptidase [Bacteroidota bacterium]
MKFPIIDMHCDLLSYLEYVPGADPFFPKIGCNLNALKAGNVKLQVMAIYTGTEKGSSETGLKESEIFKQLLKTHSDKVSLVKDIASLNTAIASDKTGMVVSIENASGFCEEDEPVENGFKKLDKIISNVERVIYISFTHHGENRFGGGNYTEAGLKDDGKKLLDYMSGKKIALDLSHTSDALAYGQLEHIDKHNLDIPIIASHSNFSAIFDHPRNLPDDLAKEIIKRKGIIGVNFLRAFLNNDDPDVFYDHVLHCVNKLGGENAICFGADYFFASEPDPKRLPYYHKDKEDASCYPALLKNLEGKVLEGFLENMSHKNVVNFINRIWKP